jgi:hypothetical protein
VKTTVYVDGYNFYYACCKGTGYKWVNPKLLAETLLPGHTITKVFFFTAAVKAEAHDPSKRHRQYVYWRALGTVPEIEIVLGKFLESPKRLPWNPPKPIRNFKRWCCKWPPMRKYMGPLLLKVWKIEEKHSDVNLATQLLMDALNDRFECAAIISNDSDLMAPIRTIRTRFKKNVGMLTGHEHPSKTLQKHIDFIKPIREGVLANSQFPSALQDAEGSFHKPESWCVKGK